jgi:hypothetical protein
MVIKDVVKILKTNKYKNIKVLTANRLSVFVETKDRIQVLNHIAKILKGKYNNSPCNYSSVGTVEFKNFNIYAKPLLQQGINRPGVTNEVTIIKRIKNYIKKQKKINVCFKSDNKKVIFKNIVNIKHTGTIISARQKADMILVDHKGKIFPISIKKDNATIWESADTYCVDKVKKCLQKLAKNKKVKLYKRNGAMHLFPKIAIRANRKESRDVIFGSDLKNNGLVVQRTFKKEDMVSKNNNLEIKCSNLIRNLRDVDKKHKVWFHVRVDVTRNMPNFYPGLRIFAIMEKGICSTFLRVK